MKEIKENLFCTQFELKTLSELMVKGEAERWVKGFLHPKYENEHIDRYDFALQFVNGKNVLDIACGSGYGSLLLAQKGKALHVTGIDLDADAVRYGNFRHMHDSVQRFSGDACTYLSANPYDVIISFETIEHLPDFKSFLNNIDRNLSEEGLFIISTPISKQTTIKPTHNPYHEIEWSYGDFIKLLKEYFTVTETFIQNGSTEGKYPEYNIKNRIKKRLGGKILKTGQQLFQGIKNAQNLDVSQLDSGYVIAILKKK